VVLASSKTDKNNRQEQSRGISGLEGAETVKTCEPSHRRRSLRIAAQIAQNEDKRPCAASASSLFTITLRFALIFAGCLLSHRHGIKRVYIRFTADMPRWNNIRKFEVFFFRV
jgi:hypothetical protein